MQHLAITFGIVTDGSSDHHLRQVIDSISRMHIPIYEILIVGNSKIADLANISVIPFDEDIKNGWITKKKNLITLKAKYDLIVYLHDYYVFDETWYENVKAFGIDFDVCMHQIRNANNVRYHDWVLWVQNRSALDWFLERTRSCLIPYESKEFGDYLYISGGYWMARKAFMLSHPLDEGLTWGQAEDVEWSLRCRLDWNYRVNPKSIVKTLKPKDVKFREPTWLQLRIMLSLSRIEQFYFKIVKLLKV